VYSVIKNGKPALEADACGIGFLATRMGVAERRLVEYGLELCTRFDHRGAVGHGAGVQLDIPWPMLLERFPKHVKLIAQRDVALGMFFLPFEPILRRQCVAMVEAMAELADVQILDWHEVTIDPSALPADSHALRTIPKVSQALFRRPPGASEEEWFATRYLLRLAVDEQLAPIAGDHFKIVSLSNRTVVYKGLSELSKIGHLYPDLQDPDFASRYLLFHSRYCTNTTTAWRRAQPFWSLAHNGEINTIEGNTEWVRAIGRDLLASIAAKHPKLARLAAKVESIICPNGSDSANLDDMLISLLAGGLSLPESILALLPEAEQTIPASDPLKPFYDAMRVYLGACDGPAAIVASDGSTAVAHLDRNGLRPLWVEVTEEYVFAGSEITGTRDIGVPEQQRILGPGGTVIVNLDNGDILFNEDARRKIAGRKLADPALREVTGQAMPNGVFVEPEELTRLQIAFGMGSEDLDIVIEPMTATGKPSVGSMGDDTPPSAFLDKLPRRPESYFKLRFAQETSPPIDPIRDGWVFSSEVILGDRSGLWAKGDGPLFRFENRVLATGQLGWLSGQAGVQTLDLTFPASGEVEGLEEALEELLQEAENTTREVSVLILSDRNVSAERAAIPALRFASVLHERLVAAGRRHQVGLVMDAAVWDIQHVALLISFGIDAVCPWLGAACAGEAESNYLKALRSGFAEVMSMMGVTPSSAYCGARLVEAIGIDRDVLDQEFGGIPGHLEGINRRRLDEDWIAFHTQAYAAAAPVLLDAGEYRHTRDGRAHFNTPQVVRNIQIASGYAKKIHDTEPGSYHAYETFAKLVADRDPITILDCLQMRVGEPIPLDEVEPVESILWRFFAPGMSEGALSEPAHRTVARGMNVAYRYCRLLHRLKGHPLPPGIGPLANSGEGGFDKARVGTRDANRSVQYAGGRFTITPYTAATAAEAEIKFAQGAKPGKGGQLPGKKVDATVALRRGCNAGYELVSPPINHNLYSIEDVKLMLECWRHLNPEVKCALKFVASHGIEMVCLGGVNAGANRLHISDGCGGTGAAKRVDQKHAGIPAAAVLPLVQDTLVEDGVRDLVELSVDGGVQTGEQALKLFLLGADRVGFGTSLLLSIGCAMLRRCHMAGPDPKDPTGKRRLGCAPGIATQDPALVAKFTGNSRQIARTMLFVSQQVRTLMAEAGIQRLRDVIGHRDLLEVKALHGKAAALDLPKLVSAPAARVQSRHYERQTARHLPQLRTEEINAALRAIAGGTETLDGQLSNRDRCVGVSAAGEIARQFGDLGLQNGGKLRYEHEGAAGHFYAAYAVEGMEFAIEGLVADSAFTAAYGGKLVIVPRRGTTGLTVAGNTFAYGARGGKAYIAGRAGNRFGICLRKNHERGAPEIVVEGVEANGFQYMTGGTVLVLGSVGPNLGSGMTGGEVFLLDADEKMLNRDYVHALPLDDEAEATVRRLMESHVLETGSPLGTALLADFNPGRYRRVVTKLFPETLE